MTASNDTARQGERGGRSEMLASAGALTLATLLLMASGPARAGDALLGEPPPSSEVPATLPASPSVPAVPYAALYDGPLFGHAAPAAAKVDESALRFYAAGKNRARVDAEIKRLHGLHPDWKVPSNLYASGQGDDEQPLWDLFAAGRVEELRTAIQARERKEPGWRPSADLQAKLARAEVAARLVALSKTKEWALLLDLAASHPDLLACSAVDIDWRVAEAFAGLGNPGRAFEVDAALLKACRNRDERLATVRKAVDLLPAADVERLIALGDTLEDGSGEFEPVRLDLARREIGRVLAGASGGEVAAGTLDALGQATLRGGEVADAALLGWYAFSRGDWADADRWFKLGLGNSGGDAKLAEGHALALDKLGRTGEAETLAHAWRERSAVMRALFVRLLTDRVAASGTLDPGEMADLASTLEAERSAPGASALGWAAYGRDDWDAAALWFGRAVEWTPGGAEGANLPDKLVEGYGLALKRLGRLEAAEGFLYGQRDRSATARELFVAVAASALAPGQPVEPGRFGPDLPAAALTPERLDRFAEVIRAARSAPGAGAMGWRSLRDRRPADAVGWFRDAVDWSPARGGDVALVEGLVLALKDSGRLPEAEEESVAHVADSARLREAYRGIMVAQLSTPALADRLTPGRVARFATFAEGESYAAGAEALGWYRLRERDCGYATEWFRDAIRWSADGAGTAKGNEGYAQALQRGGDDLAAVDVAYRWASRSPDLTALAVEVMAGALTREFLPPTVTEGDLARFSDLVRAERSVTGAQALAWYRYRDAGNGYGLDWFADAVDWSPGRAADAKTAEGYASALRDLGRLAEAEEVLVPWVDSVPTMRDLYIDTVVSELTRDNPPEPMPHDRLARFIAAATPLRSAAAAQALGWYRYARREHADAAIWFKLAVDWWPALPADADRFTYVPEGYVPLLAHLALTPEDYRRTPRAFSSVAEGHGRRAQRYVDTLGGLATTWTGYALTLRELGRGAEAEDIAFSWRDRWPPMGRLFLDIAAEALTRPDGAPVEPERLKRYAAAVEEARDPAGAAALGWAAAKRADWTEAAVWLKAAADWRPSDAARDPRVVAGYVDALRQAGRAEEAFAAAAAWVDRLPEIRPSLVGAARDLLTASGKAALAGAEPLPADRLAQAAAVVAEDPGAEAAAALGWYHYGAKQPAAALPAFKRAVALADAAAPGGDAGTLPKALEGFALTLRALGRDADALAFVDAWSGRVPALGGMAADIAADLLTRGGGEGDLPPPLLARLSAVAAAKRSVPAAAAFGWYGYAHRDWAAAARWFGQASDWSPDRKGPLKVVEGYAASLRRQCRFVEAATAAAGRMDEDATGALRRIFVDSVSGRVAYGDTAAAGKPVARGATGVVIEPGEAARFAAATLATSSANGAQALGWYAYRSRQFPAAAAWFGKAVSWDAVESNVFGLALSQRRLGDAEGLGRTLSLYGSRFRSLEAIRRAGLSGADPIVPDFIRGRSCEGQDASDPSKPAAEGAMAEVPAPVQGAPEPTPGLVTAPAGRGDPSAAPRRLSASLSSSDGEPPAERARAGAPAARRPAEARTPARPERADPPGDRAPTGSATAALAAKDYARCLAILDRRGARGAGDRNTEGWCLLGLDRPSEAALAFRSAEAGTDAHAASDGALGETLSHLREGDAAAAAGSASRTRLGEDQRRALGVQILSRQAYAAYEAKRWPEALDALRRRSDFAADTRDVLMLRGWSHYQLGDLDAARQAFTAADARLSDSDSRRALAVVTTAATPKAFR